MIDQSTENSKAQFDKPMRSIGGYLQKQDMSEGLLRGEEMARRQLHHQKPPQCD